MASGDQHSRCAQTCDRPGRHRFGGERHEFHASGWASEQVEFRFRWCANEPIGVNAATLRADEWPLDMDAQYSRHACRDGCIDGLDRTSHGGEIVADESREKAGRSMASMGLRDGLYRFDGRFVVEQNAAAAIDLGIDETRNEIATLQLHALVRWTVERPDLADEAILDRDCRAVPQAIGRDDFRAAETMRAHRVRVILERWGGRSGSSPRLRASASTRR